jgi:hypothetical protein
MSYQFLRVTADKPCRLVSASRSGAGPSDASESSASSRCSSRSQRKLYVPRGQAAAKIDNTTGKDRASLLIAGRKKGHDDLSRTIKGVNFPRGSLRRAMTGSGMRDKVR